MEIQRIADGEIIDRPGLYEMSLAHYHSQCCDGPSVSSTGLRAISLKSPLHFYDSSAFNPNRPVEDFSDPEAIHFRLGRAAHFLMLEPEKFAANIAVRPDKFDSWRTDLSKTWRTDRQSEGFTIMTPEERDNAFEIASTLKAHPWHAEGILAGLVETSMICQDSKTGIWIKSRPDSIPINDAFTDLKVCRDSSPDAVARAIKTLGYDMQMALAGVCMQNLTDGERTVDQFWIVAVEAQRPHAIHVATLSTGMVYWARVRLRHALDTMAKCLADNYWPSYGLDGAEVAPTPYEQERFDRFQKSGLLPQKDEF